MSSIYRKSSLDRLSSPEQLDKMIHITRASEWLALLGMLLIVLAAGYWAFFGEVSEKIFAEGIYMDGGEVSITSGNTGDSIIYCYVPLSISKKLEVGMDTNLLPTTANEQETGYLLGRVTGIGHYGISKEEMYEKLGDDLVVNAFRNQNAATEPIVEVEIQLLKDVNTKSGYAWSNINGENTVITDYTLVKAYIITGSMSPFEKFKKSLIL